VIKAVFFDLVGTLVYSKRAVSFEDASNYLFDRGYDVSPQQFRASWLFVVFVDYPRYCFESWEVFIDRVLSRLGVEVDDETFRGLLGMFDEQEFALYPDSLEAVSGVKKLGLKTAIVTTTPYFMFYKSIEPVRRYVDYIITGCEVGCDKSNPRMYLKALELVGVKPEECVVVGDDVQLDVHIPKKLGMYSILLDRRRSYKDEVVDVIVGDLGEAVRVIVELSSQLAY